VTGPRLRRWVVPAAIAGALAAADDVRAQPVGPLFFHPVEPCRLLDTRTSSGGPALTTDTPEPPPPAPPMASSVVRPIQVRGFGTCAIAAEAAAVVYNLTVVAQPFTGHLTLYPSDVAVPVTSSLNFPPSTTIANGGIVRLNTSAMQDLKVRLFLGGAPVGSQAHIVIDVTGYFAP